MSDKVSEPSYAMSAVGGLFLGILGMAILLIFPDAKWGVAVVPVAGLFAAILGTYVAAEPYEDLRENYDKLLGEAAELMNKPGVVGADPKLSDMAERLEKEALRLTKEAASVGADGLMMAEAAEFMRKEADLAKTWSGLK